MNKTVGFWGIVVVLAAGCTATAPGTATQNALGITSFQIDEAATELSIVGVDASGTQVGSVILSLGSFADPDDGHLVDFGRTLSIDVRGFTMVHKSAGLPPLRLPIDASGATADVVTFLQDAHVAPLLAQHGIEFAVKGFMSDEVPYSVCSTSCSYGRSASCGTNTCGEYTYVDGHTYEGVCCQGSSTAVNRECTGTGSDGCGPEGPNGCAVCWSYTFASYCAVDYSDVWCAVYHDGTNKNCGGCGAYCADNTQCCGYPDDEGCLSHHCVCP